MARIKGGLNAKKRHNRVLKLAKGYRGARSKQYRIAKQSVMRALANAYAGRKERKRQFRQLWIARINAAARMNGLSYSKFMYGLKLAGVDMNRKMLAEMAVNDAAGFAQLVELAKQGLVNEPVVKNTVEEVVAPVVAEEATDLESLKVADLRELAKSKGVAGYSTMKKAELIEALNN